MDPKTPQYWAKLLWSYFKPQVASGNPVYFTVSSGLIKKLYTEANPQADVNPKSVEEYFNTACSKLLCLGKSKVTVEPFVFTKQKNGFSCSIVLAAQQILVVEEMASAENFTEDAYFPRYREKINFTRAVKHSNPFDLEDFFEIWEALKGDVLSISGSNQYSITFKKGSGRKNITRNFPMTQALFSQNDLQKLRDLVARDNIKSDSFRSSTSLQQFFDQNKSKLTKMAQYKIKIEGMRRGLYHQFRNYLDIPAEELTNRKTHKERSLLGEVENGKFVVSLKTAGFRRTYCLRYKISFEKTLFGEQMWGYLDSFTNRDGVFVLNKTENFSGYSNIEYSGELREGDSFILFYRNEKESEVKSKLDYLFDGSWESIFFRIDVEGPSNYSFFMCKSLPDWLGSLPYEDGKLITEIILLKERLICSGGFILDKTQNLYLKNYPPEEFIAGSYRLGKEDIVDANGIPMTIGTLRDKLLKVDDYDSFRIKYKGFKIEIKIKSKRETQYEFKSIGFNFIDGKYISPITDELSNNSLSLRGWFIAGGLRDENIEEDLEFDSFEIAWLMREIDSSWIPTNKRVIDIVLKGLVKKEIPDSIQGVLEDRLNKLKILPAPLICRHKILEAVHAN